MSRRRGWRSRWCSSGGWPFWWLGQLSVGSESDLNQISSGWESSNRKVRPAPVPMRVMTTPVGVVLPFGGGGGHLALLQLHEVSGENLVWVSLMDDGGAWALQSPWRCRLQDRRHLFWLVFSSALSYSSWSMRGGTGGMKLHLVIGCRWFPFPRTFSACSMALPESPFLFKVQSGQL
jgi:hypothetical protein